MRRLLLILTFIVLSTVCIGCIDRRFVVDTNVRGAQVFVNNRPIGPAPADTAWEFPGRYQFRAVAPGYEPLTECRTIEARWYDYPPFDFALGVLWPFHIEDVRRISLELQPAKQVNVSEVEAKAEELRQRTRDLPAPSVPDDQPKGQPGEPTTRTPVVLPPN